MHSPSVAIIDIGSNSIKILVATRSPDGRIVSLKHRTIDARISAGISRSDPRLSEDGMGRGLAAIQSLLAEAAPFSPTRTVLVATSAVRDARNGADFIARVHAATGVLPALILAPARAPSRAATARRAPTPSSPGWSKSRAASLPMPPSPACPKAQPPRC